MRLPQDYDFEALAEAVTALDWSTEHPSYAMKTIQATVCQTFGDELSDGEAQLVLCRLLEYRFIRTRIHPEVIIQVGRRTVRRRAKYVRVPQAER